MKKEKKTSDITYWRLKCNALCKLLLPKWFRTQWKCVHVMHCNEYLRIDFAISVYSVMAVQTWRVFLCDSPKAGSTVSVCAVGACTHAQPLFHGQWEQPLLMEREWKKGNKKIWNGDTGEVERHAVLSILQVLICIVFWFILHWDRFLLFIQKSEVRSKRSKYKSRWEIQTFVLKLFNFAWARKSKSNPKPL